METIRIIEQGDRWMAYFSDDKEILPTPFSPRSRTAAEVQRILQERNPGCLVTID